MCWLSALLLASLISYREASAYHMHMARSGPAFSWIHTQSREETRLMEKVCPRNEDRLQLSTTDKEKGDEDRVYPRIIDGTKSALGMFPYQPHSHMTQPMTTE